MVPFKILQQCSKSVISLYGFVGIRNYVIINEDNILFKKFSLGNDGTEIDCDDNELRGEGHDTGTQMHKMFTLIRIHLKLRYKNSNRSTM